MSRWPMVPLGEVLTKSEDWIQLHPDERYKEITVRLWGNGVTLRREVIGAEIASSTRLRVRANQFIISRIDARNGASGLIPDDLEGAVVSNDFPVFTPKPERLEPKFLGWMSKTRNFVEICKAASEGTTNRVRLKENRFLTMQIPLPPLAEQRRLVERIDALAAKIEEGKRLRREADQDRELIVHRASAAILQADRWPSCPLGDLLFEDSRNGLGARPSDEPLGVPILRISAGTSRPDGIVDEKDHKYLPVSETELETYQLREGDLLACRFNGNLHYVGRFSVYLNQRKQVQVYPDKLIRFRVDRSRVIPEFVRLAMNSPFGREKIEVFCATTAGNIGISATALKTVPVPIPPINVQERMVSYLHNIQQKISDTMSIASKAGAELDAMLPAILDRAFRGELCSRRL